MELVGINVIDMASTFGEVALAFSERFGRAKAKKKRGKRVRPCDVLPAQFPQATYLNTIPPAAILEIRRALVEARRAAGTACLVGADQASNPLD